MSGLGEEARATRLYMNDGSEISGASVAAVYDGRMLVGSVCEDEVLLCEL